MTHFNAGVYKNDAATKKTEAANQWAYYQAKSNKQHLSELGIDLAPEARKAFYRDEVERYTADKNEIEAHAKRLEAQSVAFDEKSAHQSHAHHRWAQATTVLQVSIAMAAIALLTQRKWLVYGVLSLGAIGTALGAMAWMSV